VPDNTHDGADTINVGSGSNLIVGGGGADKITVDPTVTGFNVIAGDSAQILRAAPRHAPRTHFGSPAAQPSAPFETIDDVPRRQRRDRPPVRAPTSVLAGAGDGPTSYGRRRCPARRPRPPSSSTRSARRRSWRATSARTSSFRRQTGAIHWSAGRHVHQRCRVAPSRTSAPVTTRSSSGTASKRGRRRRRHRHDRQAAAAFKRDPRRQPARSDSYGEQRQPVSARTWPLTLGKVFTTVDKPGRARRDQDQTRPARASKRDPRRASANGLHRPRLRNEHGSSATTAASSGRRRNLTEIAPGPRRRGPQLGGDDEIPTTGSGNKPGSSRASATTIVSGGLDEQT